MNLKEQTHSANVKTILREFPASIGSKNWPEIMRLADEDLDKARALADAGNKFKQVRARNEIARRMRIQRIGLFTRLNIAEKEIRTLFSDQSNAMYEYVLKHGDSTGKIARINLRLRLMTMEIRRELKRVIYGLIKDGAKMGFKHAGDALLPIFQANRESFGGEIDKIPVDRLLFEAQLVVTLKTSLANKDPRASQGTIKWQKEKSRVVRKIAKTNLAGQTFSERVVDLSARAEADMRRRIANGIANGESPQSIAKDVKKYVGPYDADVDAVVGPGLYKNPFRNAMRIARRKSVV